MDRESGTSAPLLSGAAPLSPAESSSDELLRKLNQVQNLVADALSATNCACAGAAASAVDSSVRRARTKARMLPSLGTDLVFAALDEVAWEIASMPEASVANATLMRRLTEEGMPAAGATAPLQATPSARSQRGEAPTDIRVESFVDEKRSSTAPAPPPAAESDVSAHGAPSSVLSVLRAGEEAEEDVESTAGTSEGAATAADTAARLMDPLRRLAAEAAGADEAAALRRTLRLKKPKSGDLRLARELDFDECVSPRAGASPPAAARAAPPRLRGACLEFGIGPEGEPQAVEPLHPEVDQYSPMGPRTPQHGVLGSSGGVSGGTGQILTLKGEQPPSPSSRIHMHPIHIRQMPLGGSPGSPGSPRRPWRALGALRSRSVSASPPASPSAPTGGLGMGATEAEAGMPPPGMLPTARVEGRGTASSGAELIGSSPGEESMEEEEMEELCSQLKSGLGV